MKGKYTMKKYLDYSNKIVDDTRKIKINITIPHWISIPALIIIFLFWKRAHS